MPLTYSHTSWCPHGRTSLVRQLEFHWYALRRSPQIAFHTMSVLTGHSNDPASGQGLVFLHKLVDGYAAPSFGLHCASMAGVEQGVLQRAAQVCRDRCNAGHVPWRGGLDHCAQSMRSISVGICDVLKSICKWEQLRPLHKVEVQPQAILSAGPAFT